MENMVVTVVIMLALAVIINTEAKPGILGQTSNTTHYSTESTVVSPRVEKQFNKNKSSRTPTVKQFMQSQTDDVLPDQSKSRPSTSRSGTTNEHETSVLSPDNVLIQQETLAGDQPKFTEMNPTLAEDIERTTIMGICQHMEQIGNKACRLIKIICEKFHHMPVVARMALFLLVGVGGVLLTALLISHTRCKPMESHMESGRGGKQVVFPDAISIGYRTEILQNIEGGRIESDEKLLSNIS
ncbi:uncharacterized protein [Ptychodera flava]|uniref:uncharacterized protein n=1 Tax=Ptychodera flava TaxID=63121 RepID=UPI00396A063E